MRKEVILALLGFFLFIFLTASRDIQFMQINESRALGELFWDIRITDTLMQAIIIFTSLLGASYLLGGEKWKY